MTPFVRLRSLAVPLLRDNIDTDAIIPSREIRAVSKTGLADGLFAGWRYLATGKRDPDPAFVLNDSRLAGASILLGGANFGCGSSREHAAWALAEYGFRAIVADSFNPIFQGNCVRNGLLPVVLDPRPLADAGELTIDLSAQTITGGEGKQWGFTIDAEPKTMLLEGLDAITLTLRMQDAITAFQVDDVARRPWVVLASTSEL